MIDSTSTAPAPANGVTSLGEQHAEILLTECESTDARSVGTISTSATDWLLAEAQRYLAKWQPRLRLVDWDIWIEIGDVEQTNWAAQSDKDWRARQAHITFPANFVAKTRECGEFKPETTDADLVEQTVIHELLHILEEPEASHVNDDVAWIFGDQQNGGVLTADFRNAWRDYREWWINHMVRTLLESERTHGWTP